MYCMNTGTKCTWYLVSHHIQVVDVIRKILLTIRVRSAPDVALLSKGPQRRRMRVPTLRLGSNLDGDVQEKQRKRQRNECLELDK